MFTFSQSFLTWNYKMESLYHETNRNLESAYECFVRLERSGGESSTAIEREILARIDQIVSNVERLEILVGKEAPHRRQFAKVRVQQLKADVQHLSSSVRSIQVNEKSFVQQTMTCISLEKNQSKIFSFSGQAMGSRSKRKRSKRVTQHEIHNKFSFQRQRYFHSHR